MSRRVWRVSRHADGWQVRRDGAARATRTFSTQQSAVVAARRRAEPIHRAASLSSVMTGTVRDVIDHGQSKGLSYAGVVEGPDDLGTRSEKHLAEHFSQADAAS